MCLYWAIISFIYNLSMKFPWPKSASSPEFASNPQGLPPELTGHLERIAAGEVPDLQAYLEEVLETTAFPDEASFRTFLALAYQESLNQAAPIPAWDEVRRELARRFPGRLTATSAPSAE